ncbi:MAG: cation diffusion facilitator family transporter [Solirubrobacteraceae bacterium]
MASELESESDVVADWGQQSRSMIVSLLAATLLVALKLVTGLITGSLGLISAGVESSGDVLAAGLTFFVVRVGRRPADRDHPYGHDRAENLGALGEAGILIVGGLFVSVEAIRRLIDGTSALQAHGYVFVVIAVALAVDLSRTVVSLRAARRFASAAMRSNAYHFASDMAGSIAVLIGLIAVRAGFQQADAIAALVVSVLIFAAATRLIASNVNALMDHASPQASAAAERSIAALGPEIELQRLRLRESAGRYFADVVVGVPPGRAVVEGHQAADAVEAAIAEALPGSDVVVHVEPRRRGLDLRERVLHAALSEPLVCEAHDIAIFEQEKSVSVSLHLKFPADLALQTAHVVAERVEQTIGGWPGVADVQTHLEPLERALPARPADAHADQLATHEIERLVHERTGEHPLRVKLLATDAGRVLFLTLGGRRDESLSDAHQLASELEEELRRRLTDIADVVVHTEP